MTANGKLLRIEPVTMLLAGFKGSRELSEAEKVVGKLLTGFPESVLLIYDKLDPSDPNLKDELYQRGIERLPHLLVLKDDQPIFSYNSIFNEAALSSEFFKHFSTDQIGITQEMLCPDCIEQYIELKQKSDSIYYLSFEPMASLVWDDEHPGRSMDVVGHCKQCKDWMTNVQIARNFIWDNGYVAEEHKDFWEQSQKLLPGWPGFNRTILNDKELESYKACVEEKDQIFEMLINEYNTDIHYRCTGHGFVLKGFTCRPTVK